MNNWINNFQKLNAEITENSFVISSGNKKYIFENSILPTKIEIDGENVLVEPVRLDMEFKQGTGAFEDLYYKITEKTEAKIVAIAGATCGNVVINATITAEVDGFVKIDFIFSSFWMYSKDGKRKPQLNKMNMKVCVKKEYSELFHYWPNDRQSILPAGNIVNSGETKECEFMFKPYVWTGNNDKGLGLYFGDTFEPFQLDDDDKCIVINKDENTTITLNMLESMPLNWQGREDDWRDTLKPKFFTIGFQATPVIKKNTLVYDEYYKRMHTLNDIFLDKSNARKFADKGVKWVIVHEEWSAVQNYGMPYDEEKFKEAVEEYHKNGIKVMTYFGYEYSTITPDFTKNCNEYLIKNADDNFTGGWQRKPAQRAFMACYQGGYACEMRERVKYVMDELGVDGIYTDGTYVPWECANFSHGCGYVDKDGAKHTTFPLMAVRNHVKELYKIVHERNGIIDTHNSSCCIMPTLAFADSCYDGENINTALKKEGIEFLSLKGFRAEYMGKNYGFIPNFIAYVSNLEQLKAITALTLLHNVHVRPSNFSSGTENSLFVLDYLSSIWKIFDQYNIDKKQWIPYFENKEIKVLEDKAYASIYKDEKEVVVIVSSFVNKTVTLEAKGYNKVINIVNMKEYEMNDDKVILEVNQNSPEFFIFK